MELCSTRTAASLCTDIQLLNEKNNVAFLFTFIAFVLVGDCPFAQPSVFRFRCTPSEYFKTRSKMGALMTLGINRTSGRRACV